jgi:RNA-directed DNA polymerase
VKVLNWQVDKDQVSIAWLNAFKYANIKVKLEELDEWIRRLGVATNHASACCRTSIGGWAVAQSPILGTTITKERLRKRGYMSLSEMFKVISEISDMYTLFLMF